MGYFSVPQVHHPSLQKYFNRIKPKGDLGDCKYPPNYIDGGEYVKCSGDAENGIQAEKD